MVITAIMGIAAMTLRGRFITVEGGEGVGKSLFCNGISKKIIEATGVHLIMSREPGGTPSADLIRKVFSHPAENDPLKIETEAFLVSAARAQHVGALIRPALDAGTWVISDRFADSTRLYQGLLGGLDLEILESLISFSTGSLEPDLTFLLDCDVKTALSRVRRRGEEGEGEDGVRRYDDADLDFHLKLREGYLGLYERFPQRIVKINAQRNPEESIDEGFKVIRERFGI